MKALIIAEDESFILKVSQVLKDSGYDIIIYRWLLKALDNVEEIAPDLAIISTTEYPRHWKTFAQFTESGLGGIVPKIILYNSRPLSSEDAKKAESLNIIGNFTSIDDNGIEKLKSIIKKNKNGDNVALLFTNPVTQAFVSGNVLEYNDDVITFEADFKELVSDLTQGFLIKSVTIIKNGVISYKQAKVLDVGNKLLLKVTV